MRYWSQVTFIDGAEPESWTQPPSAPTWNGVNRPFEEFMDESQGMALIATTERETATEFFLTAQQPLIGRGPLTRSRQERLGKFTLPAGPVGQRWADPSSAAEGLFGAAAVNPAYQQWFMAWLVSGGAPLPVLEVCNTPPRFPPPDRACDSCGPSVSMRVDGYPTPAQPGGDHEIFGIPKVEGACDWKLEVNGYDARVWRSQGKWFVLMVGYQSGDSFNALFEGRQGAECPFGTYTNAQGTAVVT